MGQKSVSWRATDRAVRRLSGCMAGRAALTLGIALATGCFVDSRGDDGGVVDTDGATGDEAGGSSGESSDTGSTATSDPVTDSDGDRNSETGLRADSGGTDVADETGDGSNCPASVVLLFDALTQASALSNFVAPVIIAPSDIDYALTELDGSDLHFVSEDGDLLAFEVDTWTRAGTSVFWVRVPAIDGDAHDRITLCYGGEPTAAPNDVWDDDFVGVWHFSEDPDAPDIVRDASANAHDGLVSVQARNVTPTPTLLGAGLAFENSDDAVEVASAPTLATPDALTIEVVVRPDDLSVQEFQAVLRRVDTYEIRTRDQVQATPRVSGVVGFDVGTTVSSFLETPPTEGWHYLTLTYDITDEIIEMCMDGTGCLTTPYFGETPELVQTPTAPLFFGRAPATLDDVRISRTRRTKAWIEATARGYTGTLLTPL